MKILYLHPSNELYGADRSAVRTVNALSQDHEVVFLIPNNGILSEYIKLQTKNVKIIEIEKSKLPLIYRAMYTGKGMIRFLQNMKNLKIEIKCIKPDLIYVNTMSFISGIIIGKIQKIKTVIHIREIIEKPTIVNFILSNFINIFANGVICVSKASEQNLKPFFKIKSKYTVLYNGIKDSFKQKNNFTLVGKRKFILLGRIMPEKGQWFLLKSLKELDKDILEKIQILLVGGSPPHREGLKEQLVEDIIKMGLEDVVIIKDFITNINDVLNSVDFSLVPSLMADPFPTTVLEAFSYGKPVIVTRDGGAEEIVKNNLNGFTVKRNDVNELKNAIITCVEMKEDEYKNFSKNARTFFLENLKVEVYEKKIKDYFRTYEY